MNKVELVTATVEKLANDYEMKLTKKDATAIVDALVEVVVDTVAAGDDVKISGLGTFACVEVPERRGTIQLGDKKGEEYVSPAHNAPKFKAAKAFKDIVRG